MPGPVSNLALKKALLTVDLDLSNGEVCLCLKGSDTAMGDEF